jgi:hypothetical protein
VQAETRKRASGADVLYDYLMRRLSLPFLGLLFVGCQFSASCGNKNIDIEKGREFVSSALESQVGQKPTSVTCPEKVAAKKDATFECTAAFGPATATVAIVQTDDKGGVSITSITGILIAARLEKQIADSLGQRLNAHVTVSCGERVRPAVAGDKFMCEAKDAKGASGKIAVDVADATGKVSWAAVPPEGAAPPADPAAPAAGSAAPPADPATPAPPAE